MIKSWWHTEFCGGFYVTATCAVAGGNPSTLSWKESNSDFFYRSQCHRLEVLLPLWRRPRPQHHSPCGRLQRPGMLDSDMAVAWKLGWQLGKNPLLGGWGCNNLEPNQEGFIYIYITPRILLKQTSEYCIWTKTNPFPLAAVQHHGAWPKYWDQYLLTRWSLSKTITHSVHVTGMFTYIWA